MTAKVTGAQSLQTIAANSACAKVNWKNRGSATVGYYEGLASAFGHAYCRLQKNPDFVAAKAPAGNADALAYLGIKATKGQDALIKTFTLLAGLGMRESSGCYSAGWDSSAGPETATEAEAGAWQASYNSHVADPELDTLFEEFQKDNSHCYLADFQDGKGCKNSQSIRGTGVGATFQSLEKSCPGFAAVYAAVGVRVLRNHWGPILRREVEYKIECENMFTTLASQITCK